MPNTETPPEPTEAAVTEETTEPVVTEEQTTHVESSLLDSDAFVNKVADAVFGRVKNYSESLIQASQAAQQIAADMVPVDQSAPPPVSEPPAEPPPDMAPQRRHRMFAQPFKRKQQ